MLFRQSSRFPTYTKAMKYKEDNNLNIQISEQNSSHDSADAEMVG